MVRVDGKMDGAKSRAILDENLFESVKTFRLRQRITVQQDYNLNHKAIATGKRLKTKYIHVCDRPSQSPDLHPVQNLCQVLKMDNYKLSIQYD